MIQLDGASRSMWLLLTDEQWRVAVRAMLAALADVETEGDDGG